MKNTFGALSRYSYQTLDHLAARTPNIFWINIQWHRGAGPPSPCKFSISLTAYIRRSAQYQRLGFLCLLSLQDIEGRLIRVL